MKRALLLDNNSLDAFNKATDFLSSLKENPELRMSIGNQQEGSGWFGIITSDDVDLREGTLYIPISGSLVSWAEEWCIKDFFTTYSFIEKQLEFAYNDDRVKEVVFDVNSPGGDALQMLSIAEQIKELSNVKKTTSLIQGLCCSAAYMLVANTNKIYSTSGSFIGSIGVLTVIEDSSEYYAKYGIKLHYIGTPDGKVEIREGKQVSEDAINSVKDWVTELFENIVVPVVSTRMDKDKIILLDAKVFTAQVSLSHSLIDDIINPISILKNKIPQEEDMSEQTNQTNTPAQPNEPQANAGEQSNELSSQIASMTAALLQGVKEGMQEGFKSLGEQLAKQNAPEQNAFQELPNGIAGLQNTDSLQNDESLNDDSKNYAQSFEKVCAEKFGSRTQESSAKL